MFISGQMGLQRLSRIDLSLRHSQFVCIVSFDHSSIAAVCPRSSEKLVRLALTRIGRIDANKQAIQWNKISLTDRFSRTDKAVRPFFEF